MADRRVVPVPDLADPTSAGGVDRAYRQCIAVGDWVRIAGQVGVDHDYATVSEAFEPQLHQVYDNVRRALEAAGSGMQQVVHQTVWLTDMRYAAAARAAADEVFTAARTVAPSTSVVGVHGLVQPEWHVEIEVTATTSAVNRPDERAHPAAEVSCTEAGGVAYAAGQAGSAANGQGPAEATRQAIARIGRALGGVGSSLARSLHATIWVSDARYAPIAYATASELLEGAPTVTVLVANGLERPEPPVAVELQAAVDGSPHPEPIHVPGVPDPALAAGADPVPGPFVASHGHGEWLYCSAQVGATTDESRDFETQVRSAFDRVSACLEAGDAGLEDLVHMRVYLDDMRDAWEFLQLRRELLGEHLTTSSLIGQRPPRPGHRVAIEARAMRP